MNLYLFLFKFGLVINTKFILSQTWPIALKCMMVGCLGPRELPYMRYVNLQKEKNMSHLFSSSECVTVCLVHISYSKAKHIDHLAVWWQMFRCLVFSVIFSDDGKLSSRHLSEFPDRSHSELLFFFFDGHGRTAVVFLLVPGGRDSG